jgi:hypothetical protein
MRCFRTSHLRHWHERLSSRLAGPPSLTSARGLPGYLLKWGVAHALLARRADLAQAALDRADFTALAAHAAGHVSVMRWWAALPDSGRAQRLEHAAACSGLEPADLLELTRLMLSAGLSSVCGRLAGHLVSLLPATEDPEGERWEAHRLNVRGLMLAGAHEEAREASDKWLYSAVDAAGEDSLQATRAWWQLALLESERGNPSVGAELLQDVEAYLETVLPPKCPELLALAADIVTVLEEDLDPELALRRARRLWRDWVALQGEAGPQALQVGLRVVALCARMGKRRTGTRLLGRFRGLAARTFGTVHPISLGLDRLRASRLAAGGRFHLALQLLDDIERRWSLLGGLEPTVRLQLAINRSQVLQDVAPGRRRPDPRRVAISVLEEAESRTLAVLGASDVLILKGRWIRSGLLQDLGEMGEGIAVLAQALEEAEAAQHARAHDLQWTCHLLASSLMDAGLAKEAVKAYKRLRKMLHETGDIDVENELGLGLAQAAAGHHRSAVTTLREGLAIRGAEPADPALRRRARRTLSRLSAELDAKSRARSA